MACANSAILNANATNEPFARIFMAYLQIGGIHIKAAPYFKTASMDFATAMGQKIVLKRLANCLTISGPIGDFHQFGIGTPFNIITIYFAGFSSQIGLQISV